MAKLLQYRLSREDARQLLGRIASILSTSGGRSARDAVVKLLNASVSSYSWVGVYLVDGRELKLDAWSGPEATEHVRIPIGQGVCGFAAKAGRTEIVSDVSRDSRYLECFPTTKSEIVVPIMSEEKVLGEIDIDSDISDAFSSLDREFLEAVAAMLAPTITPLGISQSPKAK
jgi:L-methionine (R)-S-oxide reductase